MSDVGFPIKDEESYIEGINFIILQMRKNNYQFHIVANKDLQYLQIWKLMLYM